jgi:hypothetical protein
MRVLGAHAGRASFEHPGGLAEQGRGCATVQFNPTQGKDTGVKGDPGLRSCRAVVGEAQRRLADN